MLTGAPGQTFGGGVGLPRGPGSRLTKEQQWGGGVGPPRVRPTSRYRPEVYHVRGPILSTRWGFAHANPGQSPGDKPESQRHREVNDGIEVTQVAEAEPGRWESPGLEA